MPDEYNDDREEDRAEAKLEIEDLNKHLGKRCCIFLHTAPGEATQVLHGRMMAVGEQIDLIVLRDMTPGWGPLRRKIQVPCDNIKYLCQAPESESCRRCPEYHRLVLITPPIKEMSNAPEPK